jgi:hypothetical protein
LISFEAVLQTGCALLEQWLPILGTKPANRFNWLPESILFNLFIHGKRLS